MSHKDTNRALLRNTADISPISLISTHWSSTFRMIQRFNTIITKIIDVSNEEKYSVTTNASSSFKFRAENYEEVLKFFAFAALELQEQGFNV